MAFKREDVRNEVNAQMQREGAHLDDVELDRLMDSSLKYMNYDRPFLTKGDITGDNSQSYDLQAAAIGFKRGSSDVNNVEFPAGEVPPVFIRKTQDWRVYEDPSKPAGQEIRLLFIVDTPQATQTIRVEIERPFTLSDTTSDLDDIAFLALVFKTVELGLMALANRFAQTSDSTIDADAVDYGGRTNNFLFAAETSRKRYEHLVGLDKDVKAAQAFADSDIKFAGFEDLFWHPARTR